MGASDGAAGAARSVSLYWRIYFGGRGPLELTTRNDALDVFRHTRSGISVDTSRSQPPLRTRREYLLFGRITAGIDLALALVEEDHGREIALAVARMMVVFPRRPGGQSQFSAHIKWEAKNRPDIGELQAWILGHPGADLSVSALADRMAMSPRNFARLFHSETGDTPAQFAERARADAARLKLEQTRVPVETIAKECGFGNAERMRRTFQRLFDVGLHDYRRGFDQPYPPDVEGEAPASMFIAATHNGVSVDFH